MTKLSDKKQSACLKHKGQLLSRLAVLAFDSSVVAGLNIELAGVNTFLCIPINRQSKNILLTAGSITVRSDVRTPRGSCTITSYVHLASKMARCVYLYRFEFVVELVQDIYSDELLSASSS